MVKLLISISLVTIILIVGQLVQSEIFFNRNDINQGQLWKIVSGNFTHSNIPHLLLNLSGVWVLGFLFIDTLSSKTFILSSAFLAVIVGLGLFYYSPALTAYYGFSGVLYGLYFVAAVSAILKSDLFTGIAVAILIAGKIIWDAINGGSQASADLIGIPVANDAHLYGFVGAIVIAVILIINWNLNTKK